MIAAVGNDGVRQVVWGLGRTARAAIADALFEGGECGVVAGELETHPVTADEVRRIRAGEVAWPLPRRRSGVRIAPRGARVDYRPSAEALTGLDGLATAAGLSSNAMLDRLVLAAVGGTSPSPK